MTNKQKLILLAFIIVFLFGILVVFVTDINCLFKTIFNIPCPGCGLTRGFRELFNGNIIGAINYNILTIPIFLFLIASLILIAIDIIKKTFYLEKYLSFFPKHYVLIIILLIISFITNILKRI